MSDPAELPEAPSPENRDPEFRLDWVVLATLVLTLAFIFLVVTLLGAAFCAQCGLEALPFILVTGLGSAAIGFPFAYLVASRIERSGTRTSKLRLAAVVGFIVLGSLSVSISRGILSHDISRPWQVASGVAGGAMGALAAAWLRNRALSQSRRKGQPAT